MKTRLTLICLILCAANGFAQLKLADKFFKSYSYIKAIEFYEIAVEEGDSSLHVLTRLGDAYYNNSKTDKSALWYGLAAQKYERKLQPEYIFKYVQSLVSLKQYDKAEAWAQKLKALQDKDPGIKNYIDDDFDVYKLSDEVDERLIIKLENLGDINTPASEFGVHISDSTLYFASARDKSSDVYDWNKEPFLDIYQAKINRGNKTISFDKPKKIASSKVNTDYHEAYVAITDDGNTLYFTRDNLTRRNRLDYTKDGTTHLQIYKATRDGDTGQWGDLEELPFNDEVFSTGHPALSPDGNKLYFASDRDGGYGQSDIYVVDIYGNGSYSEPRNLGPKVNTPGRELFPFVASDSTLYYASDGRVNYGLLDIYSSNIIKDPGAESENLGEPYNSNFDDFAYVFDPVTKQGFLSSNRENGKGSDDIYGFNAYICQQTIEGVVKDGRTQEPIPDATVKLIDETGKIIKEVSSDADGTYRFENVLCEKTFVVLGSKPDYKDDQVQVTTSDENEKSNPADLTLTPLIVDDQIVINPIFFDFDKWNIRTDAQYELENIVDVMRKHPTMVIKIESHTDSRGSERYNMRLSDRRAKSTRDYIISRGIAANRIESAIGYGESQLLNRCSNGVKCSKEEHQLNRRSYFYILEE